MYFGMSREELLNPRSLMSREIVGNEMNLLAARLLGDQVQEEGHKLLAGVPRGGFAYHLAIARVKRGIQRKGAVAVYSKPWRSSRPGDRGRDRIESLQGLDGGLFIHAKHCRMLRRFHVQPDNIGRLGLDVGSSEAM
jgi:hypothetical protein